MVIFGFRLTKGTIITDLLFFNLELGIVTTKPYCFFENTHLKCLSDLVQSAVNARFHGDKTPKVSVVSETMKLLAKSSYRYQFMDRSWHSVTGYKKDAETQAAIDTNIFKKLAKINNQLCEVRLAKSETERKKNNLRRFFYPAVVTLIWECWSSITTF